ncbi:ABC transporter ATP-binding protein [Cohnella massiliensis]|uniref:ABC transporter ATP-binding protein n=1 Tax=Cohnella massiliensis TaxID=1816691 RepID=UPI0009BA0FF0|nr:ATP-binding cassette domain-containing protein [Cohnella massiliensis]
MAIIEVENLTKHFEINKRQTGFINHVKSLFRRERVIKEAVKNISFSIEPGEIVGYIGTNGAGKSTTIKMLSGVLTPTSGTVKVDGLIPYKQRQENARQIGVVFGQRSRVIWDLPMSDSFRLYQKMYGIEETRFRRNVEMYTRLLDMEEFIDRPVRQLSLGEKMRANIAAALLHDPKVVYLDEPTIGLDVVAKSKIRDYIAEINRNDGVTVMLTTHDMSDIEKICSRIIFIHQGELFFDGSVARFKDTFGYTYTIAVGCAEPLRLDFPGLRLVSALDGVQTIEGDKRMLPASEAVALLSAQGKTITSLRLEEDTIESILMNILEK